MAGAEIIHHWLPLPIWQIGSVLMLIMICVNLMSARAYGEFEFWFASVKVTAIIVFIWCCPYFARSAIVRRCGN